MSNNQKLFKDAIADAKALREVAVANAKAALEESFMPQIQSMFERRIMESDELDEESELDEKITYTGEKDNLLDPLDETEDLEEGDDLDLEELFNSLSEEDDDMGMMEYGDEHHMSTKDALDMKEEENQSEHIRKPLEEDRVEKKNGMETGRVSVKKYS